MKKFVLSVLCALVSISAFGQGTISLSNIGGTPISSCQTLSTENGLYKLTANISDVSGTCFTISANGITLDLNGYAVCIK